MLGKIVLSTLIGFVTDPISFWCPGVSLASFVCPLQISGWVSDISVLEPVFQILTASSLHLIVVRALVMHTRNLGCVRR